MFQPAVILCITVFLGLVFEFHSPKLTFFIKEWDVLFSKANTTNEPSSKYNIIRMKIVFLRSFQYLFKNWKLLFKRDAGMESKMIASEALN